MSTHPIVVLDGPDGSGKTTLANKLVNEYGYRYRHLTYRFKEKMNLYHWAALELCLRDAEDGPVVLDRWWPSEVIYAGVFRGGSKWRMWARMLDRVALMHGVTYVWCIPSDEDAYFKRFDKLKASGREMYDSMQWVYQGYATAYNSLQSRFDMVHYDLDMHGQNLDDYLQWLMDHVSVVHGDARDYDRHERQCAGNLYNPRVLFVGEESNSKFRREVWPFFEHGNSSLWITDALTRVNLQEADLAWVNAYCNGKPQPEIIQNILSGVVGHLTVVALGHKAALVLEKLGLEYTLFKHPQWNRRFAPNDLSEYTWLKNAI